MAEVIRIEDQGRVRTLVLDRPEKRNALSHDLAWGIVTAVEKAAHDDDVWVIAITGSGEAFCSGLDLGGPGDGTSPLSPQERVMDDVSWVGRFALVLRHLCDKPIVAGVNGVAAGAGLSLAMAADMRIAARRARLISGYPRIGASPDGGLTWTLPQAIGYEQAMRFLLENRTVDADEALRLGFVGEVVDDERFAARLGEYCALLADRAPIASRLTKRGVTRATAIDLEAQVRYELANIRRAFATEDAQEARRAFFEKRPPIFHGR
ncbi:MAG: enoyl-CoA hydratase/isomerase family protein [Candidatus Rokubacteria bacterium]|nr:enoyl-CoA hydratase/isomerase family protein [Candidatus Rokubacteria bacterium]